MEEPISSWEADGPNLKLGVPSSIDPDSGQILIIQS